MLTRARSLLLAVSASAVLLATVGAAPAAADPGDIGFTDHVYTPLGNSATASKPESKLWYAGGSWWSVMFNGPASQWRIYKLNAGGSGWTDTGVNVDTRDNTRADTLYDAASGKLFIASHIFTTSSGSTAASASNSARLFRYSFNGTTWTPDAGFPVQINTATSETVTIDKDSAGVVWATWVAGTNVYVNHSTAGSNGATWGTSYVVPGSAAVSSDDISSLVAYGGNKIGVMWSNQSTGQWLFATHADGASDAAASWSTQVVPTGFSPDDHMNLKAGDDGRVYAALKTSESGSNPLVQLAVRGTNGSWSVSTYGIKSNRLTRPIVQLDEQANVVYVFVTCPGSPNDDGNGENGGDICMKSTPMSSLQFAPGAGTPVIRDYSSGEMNDATSTKQNVNASMGLYVMANNPDTDTYWHSANVLGGAPAGVAANFSATPTSGTAPLNVQFTDTSTGGPTTWTWNFGDGGTSTAQNPSHTYASPGTYTVTLSANNGGTPSTATKTNLITVNAPPSGVSASFTGTPTSGTAPLDVQFTDTSTGSPTSWSWNFGDGGTSTLQNPSHTYTAPGTYTVTLTANDGGTPSTATRTSYITVNPSGGGGGGGTSTFTPVADAHVRDTAATTNYGSLTTLRVRTDAAGDDYRTLLKFDVSGLTGAVTNAKLRLFVTDASTDGGRVYLVNNAWNEINPNGVTWSTAPSIAGLSPIASIGTTSAVGSYTEVDLGSAITGNGTYSFELVSSSTNSAIYSSREASANKPQLVLTSGDGGSPPPLSANFSGTPTSGTAPLSVVFSDSSTGAPTGWSWNFGDGGTSTSQNPSHTYTAPGTYTVTLTVSKAGVANSTKTLTNYITVNPSGGGGGGGTQQTFTAAADAHVRDTAASTNYGTLTTLRVRADAAGEDYRSLLRFDVSGLTGTIATAKLRLFVTDASPDGGRLYGVASGWSETGVTWATMPTFAEPPGASIGTTPAVNSWVEVDVTPMVAGNGSVSFLIVNSSTNSAIYSSRQGANPPQLVITTT